MTKKIRSSADKYEITGSTVVPKKYSDFMYRRVRPLMDRTAMQTLPLEHIVAEAYRQGVMDTVDVMSENNN